MNIVISQIAKKYGLKIIDLPLSERDPTDLLGIPTTDKVTSKVHYAPMSALPVESKHDAPAEVE